MRARRLILCFRPAKNQASRLDKDIVQYGPEGRTILEESFKRSSGSNGIAERVQGLEGQIWAIFVNLRQKVGRMVDAIRRLVASIPEYATY